MEEIPSESTLLNKDEGWKVEVKNRKMPTVLNLTGGRPPPVHCFKVSCGSVTSSETQVTPAGERVKGTAAVQLLEFVSAHTDPSYNTQGLVEQVQW